MRDFETCRPSSLGADLRALRKARQLRLSDVAGALGRSVGWLSQVERGISAPSIPDLKALAAVLDVSLSALFRNQDGPSTEAGYVVRRRNRRPIGSREAGLTEELLSPDLTDSFEVVYSVIQPGARADRPLQRPTQEVAYCVAGRLDLWIAGRRFEIGPGDSFRIRGEPYFWMSPHDAPCELVWVIAPPVY